MSSDTDSRGSDVREQDVADSLGGGLNPDPKEMEWEETRFRLRAYLRYWGIASEEQLDQYQNEIVARVAAKNSLVPIEDLPKAAIEEALGVVDSKLDQLLVFNGISRGDAVFSPRSGLLFAKHVSGYPSFLLDSTESAVAVLPQVRVVQGLFPIPRDCRLVMDPQKLMYYRPIVSIKRTIFWMIGSCLRFFGRVLTIRKRSS